MDSLYHVIGDEEKAKETVEAVHLLDRIYGQQKDETSVKKNKKITKGANVDGELMAKDKPLEFAVDRNETTEPATEKNKKHELEKEQQQEGVLLEVNDDDDAEQNGMCKKIKEL
ncbi:hypothetical protein OPV22_013214 [Ensete ventricosum]|uniref:Uncharacterized protein n=1 Tax=Ensete ventricosum TaxID=4639 RepID=A0AAV8R0J0_ENSVE|nr:hypothetical protein OPV22_013214 [Ensete ventricosum]